MTDIWIEYYNRKKQAYNDAIEEHMKKQKELQQKTPCENCGRTPSKKVELYGIYSPLMYGFSKWLCDECYARFHDWYYPKEEQ